jgi:glycerate dehydrogenase
MNIVFLDRDTISPQTVLRSPNFPHHLTTYGRTLVDDVAQRMAQADIVVTNKVKLTQEMLRTATRLKLIAVAATGTDNIDLKCCEALGIAVCNIQNYAIHTVPEHTFALIFALRRSICAYRESVNSGRWQDSGQFCYFDHPIRDLAGSTLGVIGSGVLGQAVAQTGKALGMKVLLSAHKGSHPKEPHYTPFEDVLAQSDVITLHCPLTQATRAMIGASEFAMMRRKPLLINTARGGLVDESVVGVALESGQISGAGFDVVSVEPPPTDHPLMKLCNRPDFILTPHVAWASDEATQSLADQLIDNIEAFVSGKPKNMVIG